MLSFKKISLILLIALYLVAGSNHFVHPAAYLKLIPPYLPLPKVLNLLAGFFEILFGLMLIFKPTRKYAVYGIILMLLAFIPAHIYMVQLAPFMLGNLAVTKTGAWVRLPLQAILIAWAYWHRKD
ncbi:DoxX family protein [Mucilaginibacter arboris]|uniref:DoxX family protein n=1 Tax=Mucilaginibacter arboris TaxID=2682090 RepID=A0A7K1STI8_9SPHI|nr:MauE/DoxX family redox-associated membrane protein [Mucilaginibacter arboris]MVN20577.1 DoxX family protein [Mucilaginibacter arboris]